MAKSFSPVESFENLETRMMMCADHILPKQNVVELLQQAVNSKPGKTVATRSAGSTLNSSAAGEPADIVWTNRGSAASDTDGFNARFGTSADLARGVVDAVIVAYERMIGSFNYSTAGATYSLSLNMSGSGSGFGASAGLNSSLGGKPKSGSITMGAGNGSANANDTNGWFMDPTPFESSEFQGTITNAYSGDAQAGSPASGLGDFYTVVAAEMTHCMGLFGSSLTMWSSKTTNTNIADTAEGGGTGTFWVFNGPSIKHLMTSNNGGSGGQNFGSAVHSAGPGSISFNGDTYNGAQDQGNAVYEFGRRYMINNTFALMFKDAYGYSTVDPAKWGTTYSILNETTKAVNVRGSSSTDAISITRSGNTVTVSVNPTVDVAGTGALPGAGDLPAFVTEYDISQISSITIDTGSSDDTIALAPNIGVPITLNAGSGTADVLTIQGTSGNDTISVAAASITGAAAINYSAVESLIVNGNDGNDTINFNGTGLTNVNVNGGNGDDTLSVTNGSNASLVFNLGADANTLNWNSGTYTIGTDLGAAGTMTVNINAGTLTFTATQHLTALNIASGAAGSLQAGGTRVMVLNGLSIAGTGNFDLNDNDAIIDYTGGSVLGSVQGAINSARNGGNWLGSGLNSSVARQASPQNTTLGAMEGSDYLAIYGPGATLAGESVDASSVLVKFTYYGDADFNGVVNFDDYSRTDAGFNFGRSGWSNGDYDGNGVVNFDDYSLIDLAFNTQGVAL